MVSALGILLLKSNYSCLVHKIGGQLKKIIYVCISAPWLDAFSVAGQHLETFLLHAVFWFVRQHVISSDVSSQSGTSVGGATRSPGG